VVAEPMKPKAQKLTWPGTLVDTQKKLGNLSLIAISCANQGFLLFYSNACFLDKYYQIGLMIDIWAGSV